MTKRYGIDFWLSRFNTPAIYGNFKALTDGKDLEAIMKAWWPLKEACQNKILCAHSVDTYMACLMGSRDEAFAKLYITVVSVLCPVDVEIYVSDESSENLLVGRVVDNVIDEEVSDGVYIYVDGDRKYIYLPYEGDYTFKMIGTDTGTMTYSVQNIDMDTGEAVEEKNFMNVALESGKEFTSSVKIEENTTADIENEKDSLIKVKKIKISGISKKIAAGKKITAMATDGSGKKAVVKINIK